MNGRIWVARNPKDQFCSSEGLKNLILDNLSNPIDIIEKILSSYQTQEEYIRNAQRERDHDNWRRGKMERQDEDSLF